MTMKMEIKMEMKLKMQMKFSKVLECLPHRGEGSIFWASSKRI